MSAVPQATPFPSTQPTPAAPKRPATVYHAQKMKDGREVQFAGDKKLIKEWEKDEKGEYTGAVRFDFRNGETRLFKAPATLHRYFIAHGISQKIGDETAGEVNVNDMVVAVDDMIGRLSKGEWTIKKQGESFAGAALVIAALIEAKPGTTREAVTAFLNKKQEELKCSKKALLDTFRNPKTKVGQIVLRLEREQLDKTRVANADDLLKELV